MEGAPITTFMKAGLLDLIWDTNRNGIERNLLSIILQFRKYPYTGDEIIAGFMPIKPTNPNNCMKLAIIHGHIKLVELFINVFDVNLEEGLQYAALYGKLDIVKLFMSHGAENLLHALQFAVSNDHEECVAYIANKCSIMKIKYVIDIYKFKRYNKTIKLLDSIIEYKQQR